MNAKSAAFAASAILLLCSPATAGQAPESSASPDRPVTARDRVYLSDQTSNTVSVVDPANNRLLGVIRLGMTPPATLSPLYTGQLLVHGMGFSPDHRTLDVVSIGSNSVTFIDTTTNRVKHTAYVGRSPHEAFFTPDGKEVWVTIRGENYVSVLDAATYREKMRVVVPNGPGMTIFSPDGRFGYVCSSFAPETVVIDRAMHRIIGRVAQPSPFCPDIAATPDGSQVWETLKDTGRVLVFHARPPFAPIAVLETGPITNHVNFARTPRGQFAYVSVGGENVVKVFTTSSRPTLVATILTGALPHGVWPSGDGSRIYVGLENADALAVIDTATNSVLATIPSGQAPQGIAYVPDAVRTGDGTANLEPLGATGNAEHVELFTDGSRTPSTSVAINNEGLIDVVQVAASGLRPKHAYALAVARDHGGKVTTSPVVRFVTNPSGAAVASTIVQLKVALDGGDVDHERRYLVISDAAEGGSEAIVQAAR
jgi:YVTN family beta-propeller protein